MCAHSTNAATTEEKSLLRTTQLTLSNHDGPHIHDLSICINPGLTLIRSTDERSARGLISALVDFDVISGDAIDRRAKSLFWDITPRPDSGPTQGREWLDRHRQAFASWDVGLEADLIEEFELDVHIDKPLYMFSRGSFRKLGLVAAFACGADVAFMETPFAALDGRSCVLLAELLNEAAAHSKRAWVVSDYEVPPQLLSSAFSNIIDLGL
jgi:hypothetical protein